MGDPQVTMVVSIPSHGLMIWMIWGTTILGNLQDFKLVYNPLSIVSIVRDHPNQPGVINQLSYL